MNSLGAFTEDRLATHRRAEALHFDAFTVLPRRRTLIRDDDLVRSGGRAFDLLVPLASRAGEIVSHTGLIDAVWPNCVVSLCNLKTQIGTLQKILGVSPNGSRYIKNVALRGYVFVADVYRPTWPVLNPSRADLHATAANAQGCH